MSGNIMQLDKEKIDIQLDLSNKQRVVELWGELQKEMQIFFGADVYRSWFRDLKLIDFDIGSLNLSAKTGFVKEWIITNYTSKILYLAKKIMGQEVLRVTFVVDKTKKPNLTKIASSDFGQNVEKSFTEALAQEKAWVLESTPLNKDYNFDSFIVGKENRMAYTAAYNIAENSGVIKSSNPLYLHAEVGLGKTHLLHSIASKIQKNRGDRVLLLSCERFIHNYISAVRSNNLIEFKNSFNEVDVLLLDDIQFLCGKKATQEEFLNVFNLMIDNNKQLVVVCDREPKLLDGLEDRIKNRMSAGLVLGISPIEFELKEKILESKLNHANLDVGAEEIRLICSQNFHSARELEGVVNKLLVFKEVLGDINSDNIHHIIEELFPNHRKKAITLEGIEKAVAEYFGVSLSEICDKNRSRKIVYCRRVLFYLCREFTSLSIVEIGKRFGDRDHATVIYSLKKLKEQLEKDAVLKDDIKTLEVAISY